jgi:hypothetical protein
VSSGPFEAKPLHIALRSQIALKLPSLPSWIIKTFEDEKPNCGLLEAGQELYRYGSDSQQIILPGKGPWYFMTADCFDQVEEAVESLCLLDHTAAGTYDVDVTGGKILVKPTYAARGWSGAGSEPPWNSGRWRARFVLRKDIPVWFGITGPMAFDLKKGQRYTGSFDSAHLTRRGGASQVMVHSSFYPQLNLDGGAAALSRTLH